MANFNGTIKNDVIDASILGVSNDDINAIGGNDTITGGAGNDRMQGGSGSDTFVFQAGFGHDQILDFTTTGTKHDFISIDDALLPNFQAVIDHSEQVGSDVLITVDDNNTILLQNVQLSALSSSDFLFF